MGFFLHAMITACGRRMINAAPFSRITVALQLATHCQDQFTNDAESQTSGRLAAGWSCREPPITAKHPAFVPRW